MFNEFTRKTTRRTNITEEKRIKYYNRYCDVCEEYLHREGNLTTNAIKELREIDCSGKLTGCRC